MAIYDSNGSVNSEIGKIYDNDGSVSRQINKVYDNDGTASRLIYQSWDGRAFQNGDQCVDVTGGWSATEHYGGVVHSITSTLNLRLLPTHTAAYGNFHTNKPIDLSSYTNLYQTYTINWGEAKEYADLYFVISTNPSAWWITNEGVVRYAQFNRTVAGNYGATIGMYIGDLKGEYYILIVGRCTGNIVNTYTSNIQAY